MLDHAILIYFCYGFQKCHLLQCECHSSKQWKPKEKQIRWLVPLERRFLEKMQFLDSTWTLNRTWTNDEMWKAIPDHSLIDQRWHVTNINSRIIVCCSYSCESKASRLFGREESLSRFYQSTASIRIKAVMMDGPHLIPVQHKGWNKECWRYPTLCSFWYLLPRGALDMAGSTPKNVCGSLLLYHKMTVLLWNRIQLSKVRFFQVCSPTKNVQKEFNIHLFLPTQNACMGQVRRWDRWSQLSAFLQTT